MTIQIETRHDLTLETVHKVAWLGEGVTLSPASVEKMKAARARFQKLIEDPQVVIYGVSSGYGQNAKFRLSDTERKEHAKRPPFAPAASFGDPVPDRVTRAIVLARLANFVGGEAAVTPRIAEAVVEMLNQKTLPKVPARGQGGAGEILSLSHLFMTIAQDEPVEEKDVLSLINGSPAASALVADCALAARKRLQLCAEVIALAIEAFNTPLTHFDPTLDDYWANPHDAWALQTLRSLIDTDRTEDRRPYQAPVSFRIAPRILGQAQMATCLAEEVAKASLVAVTDNPTILPPTPDHPFGNAISTGGYHNAQSPAAMDGVTTAYANMSIIAERMAAKIMDGAISLLPHNLISDDDKTYLGCIPMAMTGYEEEIRMLASATLLPGSESGGFGQNDVASPVFLAWSKQEKAGELLEAGLASLSVIAMRAFDLTEREIPAALSPLASTIRDALSKTADNPLPAASLENIANRFRAQIYGTELHDKQSGELGRIPKNGPFDNRTSL